MKIFSIIFLLLFSILSFGQKFDIKIDTVYNIKQIDIVNSSKEDFFVIPTKDTSLLISSNRGQKDVQPDFLNQDRYESIWISYKKDGREWSKSKPFRFEDNITDISAVGYSTDGSYIIIYNGAWNGGDLMLAKAKDNRPIHLKSLPLNKDNSKESSGFLDIKNNKLYFTSDRVGGKGGLDIWMADIDNKFNCSNIKNIDILNSDKNEHSIWIQNDTMWFASQGHSSYGGFDIFYSVKSNDNWTEPKNMGVNVNSVADDISFSPVGNVWCSTRGENKVYNIYMFDIKYDTTKIKIKEEIKEDTIIQQDTTPIVELNKPTLDNLNDIRAKIGEEIDYCMVQVISYYKNTKYDITVEEFKNKWNITDYDLIKSKRLIKGKELSAFMLNRKFYDNNHLAIEQAVEYKKEFIAKHPNFDYDKDKFKLFINIYTKSGKRKMIFFDEKKLIYILISE